MDFKKVNREWVKSAAIIFLAVLLVLTFFSNTIMNKALPEAATAYVTSGTITAKVRGTGTVTANGKTEVKVDQTRDIRAVMVKAGQEVKTGDVLFVLGQGDSKELEAAKETLRGLQTSYQKAAVGMPTFDYSVSELQLQDAQRKLSNAEAKENNAISDRDMAVNSSDAKAALARLTDSQNKLTAREENYTAKRDGILRRMEAQQAVVNDKQAAVDRISGELAAIADTSSPEYAAKQAELTAAQAALATENNTLGVISVELDTLNTNAYPKIEETREKRDAYMLAYAKLVGTYEDSAEEATKSREQAESDYYNALYSLQQKKTTDNQSLALSSIELQSIAEQITAQQEKIKKLSGDGENQILATVNGVVDSIGCTAGETVTTDKVLCTIEVPDMGHTLSFSVTNDQAQRLRVGDTATVSNYYWGKEVVAKLINIKNDQKNPQTNKTLTFDLTGDVASGSELTISVGQKSANYDLIIPNSSIRSDTNGSFVLAVDAKNSPLGNRYVARRVNVEVLASDDVNSAVTGGLNNGDYVITTSSSPIKSGDQVRMADSTT